jgi:hypothetical protein
MFIFASIPAESANVCLSANSSVKCAILITLIFSSLADYVIFMSVFPAALQNVPFVLCLFLEKPCIVCHTGYIYFFFFFQVVLQYVSFTYLMFIFINNSL